MQTLHLIISGKVQGVFYRVNTKKTARKLGLKGWVKNTPDGKVEAVISGEEQHNKAFIEWCKVGPARAEVTDVEVKEIEFESFAEFKIVRH